MQINWDEIRKRAIRFSKEWEDETKEVSEAQTFWNEFFEVFNISRRRVASFEKPVKKINNNIGFIDLFWKQVMVVEHKSRGKNLDKAYTQALEYFHGLTDDELPKYVLVSDFSRFRLYDLDNDKYKEFSIKDLSSNIHLFGFMRGFPKYEYQDSVPVNIKASELMAKLHDMLEKSGYTGHKLEIFLVRIMFCLFSDYTGIFQRNIFQFYIKNNTKEDGSDLGMHLNTIFNILDSSVSERQTIITSDLQEFDYINGALFREKLDTPIFNTEMRKVLLKCCEFNWANVSPAIFGSMFQLVMNKRKRSALGAYYTSEKNILKIINGLFLDELRGEFKLCNNKKSLLILLKKVRKVKILDPACGCGNFLIIAYRELRLMEIEIYKKLFEIENKGNQLIADTTFMFECIDVDNMYGIEIEEFPTRIAQVGLWLVDHQMNMLLSKEIGQDYKRIPLKKKPNIVNQNALQFDWETLVSNQEVTYILGNPPFIAKQNRNTEQNKDMESVCKELKNCGNLDYVSAWYVKAAGYIKNTKIKSAFVSTSSIVQGEQSGILWSYLFSQGIKIFFAHSPFKWNNEAKGNAQVHVVIIGFCNFNVNNKYIYSYDDCNREYITVKRANNINSYLLDKPNCTILNRSKPICKVPKIIIGNMPNDGGNLIFTDDEKNQFVLKEPKSEKYFKAFIGGLGFLHNEKGWCLWLDDCDLNELSQCKEIIKRIEKVKYFRLNSPRKETIKLSETPYRFGEIRQPKSNFIIIPLQTSENRKYIPIAYLTPDVIVSNSCSIIPNASLYLFGILTSKMHMTWVKSICGRIRGDFRYSNRLVYNNYTFPINQTKEQILKVEKLVTQLLIVRDEYKNSSLADLYNPSLMPKKLLNIHNQIDKAVDACYGDNKFKDDDSRIEFLFNLYNVYVKESSI